MISRVRFVVLTCVAVLLALGPSLTVRAVEPGEVVHRSYWVDAALFSLVPDEGTDTYRSYGTGGAEPSATLGLGVAGDTRSCRVKIEPKLKDHRFVISVTIERKPADAEAKARTVTLDLSDLRAQTVEIDRDDDGRVYRLNVTPRIVEQPGPVQFTAADLRLESWTLPSSPVILNDQDYLGKISTSGGPLVWCDIPGLAKIELSLLRLKEAHAWGTLANGTIHISHPDGTALRISNVLNGFPPQTLEGGPYKVWVRWAEPSYSLDEQRRLLQDETAALKRRAAEGDVSVPPEAIVRLEKSIQSDRPTLIAFGVRQVGPDEVVASK